MTCHSSHGRTNRQAARVRALAVVVVLWALTAPGRPAVAQSLPEPQASALLNADIEEGFAGVRGGNGRLGAEWSPWWVEGSAEQRAQGQLRPPTFEAEPRASSAPGVRTGSYAQKLLSLYATHDGGFYQRVAVAPGSSVRFSMWVHVWSSSSDDAGRSHKPGDYRVSLGIDPTGGTDATSEAIVWSPEIVQYDGWLKVNVGTAAKGNAITVFTRGACSWRVKHNQSVWDDAALLVVPPSGATTLLAAGEPAPVPALASTTAARDATSRSTDGGTVNVLQNPDFEEGFSERGAGEVTVATGWEPWWQNGNENETAEGYLFRPEYKPERRDEGCGRVHAMNAAQKQFNTYATHRAGIYQRVPVTPGSRVTFSIWAYVWSSDADDPEESARPGDYRVSVGIDPTGGTDATTTDVVWSQTRRAYDRWVELTVTATAQGRAITVFARGEPGWRVKHNDAYWDDAMLVVDKGATTGGLVTASAAGREALVPGRARVLSQGAPTTQASAAPTRPAATAGLGSTTAPGAASQPGSALGHPTSNVPVVARAPRSLGEELALSYAGAHLALTWQRDADGVSIGVRAPTPIQGQLALFHRRKEIARWTIAVQPADPLALTWPGTDLDAGEMGLEVCGTQGKVLARCGAVPPVDAREAGTG